MRKGAGLIVAERAPDPVTDLEAAKGAFRIGGAGESQL